MNDATVHPKLARLLQLRNWESSEFSEATQLETLLTLSDWSKSILAGSVKVTQSYCSRGLLWFVGSLPIGEASAEAEEMLTWLGLGHLPATWEPLLDVDNSEARIEAKYSHFPEYDRAFGVILNHSPAERKRNHEPKSI